MTLALFADINWLAVAVATLAFFAARRHLVRAAGLREPLGATMDWDADEADGPGPPSTSSRSPAAWSRPSPSHCWPRPSRSRASQRASGSALVTGVGIAAAVLFVTGIFDPNRSKPLLWFAITAGYYVVGLVLVGAILGVWR
jgi:hypothetical protein